MRILQAVALAAIGCSRQPVAPPKTEPAHSEPPSLTASCVGFEGDELDRCTDVSVPVSTLRDGSVADGGIAEIQVMFRKEACDHGFPNTTGLPSTCAAQFGDRPVLGTCTSASTNGRLKAVTYRYRFATVFGSDAAMKECITEARGTWRAIARPSEGPDASAHR